MRVKQPNVVPQGYSVDVSLLGMIILRCFWQFESGRCHHGGSCQPRDGSHCIMTFDDINVGLQSAAKAQTESDAVSAQNERSFWFHAVGLLQGARPRSATECRRGVICCPEFVLPKKDGSG